MIWALAFLTKKLLSIENCIAACVVDETKSNNGLYLPPWIVQGKPVWFVIDNVDFMGKNAKRDEYSSRNSNSDFQDKTQEATLKEHTSMIVKEN